jgi:hypothetical protein
MNCGAALPVSSAPAVAAPAPTEWEYTFFSLDWKTGNGGRYPLGVGSNEQLVRMKNWGEDQGRILPDLQKWIDQGWQPVSEVGPNAYIFRRRRGNPDWLEVASFRVKLRRPRTSPLTSHESAVIGKWLLTEMRGGGIVGKLAKGLAEMSGGQIQEFSFTHEKLVTGIPSNRSKGVVSGVYGFSDAHNLWIYTDPPKFASVTAELNSTYDRMVIQDIGGLQSHYHKVK